MIEINLMPDVKQELLRAQQMRSFVVSVAIIVAIAAASIVALLAIWVYGVQTGRNYLADQNIENGASELAALEDVPEVMTIQNQLATISELNNAKRIPTRMFDLLAHTVPTGENQVDIVELTYNSDEGERIVTIEAQSTNGYAAAETFQKTLGYAVLRWSAADEGDLQEAPIASELQITETSYGEDQSGQRVLNFTLTFEYTDELLDPSLDDVQILLVRDGNVTDSYIGVPRNIFVERTDDGEES